MTGRVTDKIGARRDGRSSFHRLIVKVAHARTATDHGDNGAYARWARAAKRRGVVTGCLSSLVGPDASSEILRVRINAHYNSYCIACDGRDWAACSADKHQ